MGHLRSMDVIVFVSYVLLLFAVGASLARGQKTLKTYFLADENVHWIIVAISVLAALFSGATYLGAPAETFFHDLTYMWVVMAFLVATPITTIVFLPLFRRAKIYTAYEYLEQRFDYRLRRLASGLFISRVMFYLGLAIYAPSLAVVEITGWPLWAAVLMTGATATVYTSLGGMRAVIWTDSIQFVVLCGGIIVILFAAAAKVPGGLSGAWQLAAADGKTEFLRFDLNPSIRLTVWSALIGGLCNNLVQMVTDQIAVQRYLTAKSLRECQRAMWFKLAVTLPLVTLFYVTGTALYGYYRSIPSDTPLFAQPGLVPHLAQPASTPGSIGLPNDRLLPHFVVHHLPSPLPGLLIGAVFGATIAVVSAGINSLATASMMDFRTRASADEIGSRGVASARVLTCVFGLIATAIALWIMPKLGTIIQAANMILALLGGPLLGVFFLGALTKRTSATGALFGAAFGALAGAMAAFSESLFGFGISFMWTSVVSTGTCLIVGYLCSFVFDTPSRKLQQSQVALVNSGELP